MSKKKDVEACRRVMEVMTQRFRVLSDDQSRALSESRNRLHKAQRAYLEAAGWEIHRTRTSLVSHATLCKLKTGVVWHTVCSALRAQLQRDRKARRRA